MNNKDIRFLKGVGEKRAELFAKKGIKTVEDLLYFFPRGHEDRSKIKPVNECINGETVCIRVKIYSPVRENRIRKSLSIYSLTAVDDSGAISVMWYNNRFVKDAFEVGDEYVFYGKIVVSGPKLEMQNPVFERAGSGKFTGKIVPLYPLTGGLTQKLVQGAMQQAMTDFGRIDEYIPEKIREKYKIAEINYAMENIHFPMDFESYGIARRRFVFEELLVLQLALAGRRGKNAEEKGIVFKNDCSSEFIASLPFSPTGAQKRAIAEIMRDCSGGGRMNRLVQGDVGCGKTAVAAAAMYVCAKNGFQSAMMAPTEILARQHFETLEEFFGNSGVNVVLLTGGMKAKERRLALDMISSGAAHIAVGTHALIQEEVEFKELGLVVADEQHRFGVEQRARLSSKGCRPHMLIMSATPIPRTLALILYGDLDISVIDELPPGRKPVKTYAVGENMRNRISAFIDKNVRAGTQVYIVCPLIEETEKSDLQNAQERAQKLAEMFPHISVGLVHGRMKPKLKEEIMEGFASGKIDVLVSTTVIEVGVNVPNANIMIIENAERFGLSQLHQLRGRVGRGEKQAYCILFAHGNNEITKKRMETMCISNDGFYISEQDLRLRGPGDFFGTRQHGLPEMKIANLFEDMDILKLAQDAAREIEAEGLGKYPRLKKRCDKLLSEEVIMN